MRHKTFKHLIYNPGAFQEAMFFSFLFLTHINEHLDSFLSEIIMEADIVVIGQVIRECGNFQKPSEQFLCPIEDTRLNPAKYVECNLCFTLTISQFLFCQIPNR